MSPEPEPADHALLLLQRTRELLLDCRAVASPADQEPSTETAERAAYGVLVTALEEGLVSTLQHAMDVLKRFSAPAGPLGERWLQEQEQKLR